MSTPSTLAALMAGSMSATRMRLRGRRHVGAGVPDSWIDFYRRQLRGRRAIIPGNPVARVTPRMKRLYRHPDWHPPAQRWPGHRRTNLGMVLRPVAFRSALRFR